MRRPVPARVPVLVLMVPSLCWRVRTETSRWDRSGCHGRHGSSWRPSSEPPLSSGWWSAARFSRAGLRRDPSASLRPRGSRSGSSSSPLPSAAVRIELASFAGADRGPGRHRRVSVQPYGSMQLPSPARTEVWVVISVFRSGRRRVAVRVEAVAFAGADRGVGGHLRCSVSVRVDRGRIEPRSGWSSPRSAVGAHPGAFARADIRGGLHFRLLQPGPEPPWGQMPVPSPARTWVVVCISASVQPGPEPPWGQTLEPSAARTWVVVFIFRILSRVGGAAPRSAAARAGVADGADAGAFGCADMGGGVRPSVSFRGMVVLHSGQPPPGPEWPLGQSPAPSPARTWVGMRIGCSLGWVPALVAARRRAANLACLHECNAGCSRAVTSLGWRCRGGTGDARGWDEPS